MTAIEALRDYARTNPKSASFLLGSIACFAAIAIVLSFGINLHSSVPNLVYLFAVGLILVVIGKLIDDTFIMMLLSRFLFLLIVAWIIAFVSNKFIKDDDLGCAVHFYLPCEYAADRLADEKNKNENLNLTPASPAPAAIATQNYTVYIQFAGYRRAVVQNLAQQLVNEKWNVQGVSKGGERVSSAAGIAQVRYGKDNNFDAAKALAISIQSTKITSRALDVKQFGDIANGVLEVWIGE